MAATTKTLTPTNQTISIPAFTDKPDNRLQTDSTGKLADAVNALSEHFVMPSSWTTGTYFDYKKTDTFVQFASHKNISGGLTVNAYDRVQLGTISGYSADMAIYFPMACRVGGGSYCAIIEVSAYGTVNVYNTSNASITIEETNAYQLLWTKT